MTESLKEEYYFLSTLKRRDEVTRAALITSAHSIRGRCWWHGNRGWTFSPIFHSMLLLCNRWKERGSLTEWHLTWKCAWNKDVTPNSSMWKKLYPLTFISAQRPNSIIFYEHGIQTLIQCWEKSRANGDDCLENSILSLRICCIKQCSCALSAVFSKQINRRYYFQSKLHRERESADLIDLRSKHWTI